MTRSFDEGNPRDIPDRRSDQSVIRIDTTELEALDYAISEVHERCTKLIVTDENAYSLAGEYLKAIRTNVRAADAAKREVKTPVIAAARLIDDRYNMIVAPLKEAERDLRGKMGIFAEKKRAAEKKAQDEAVLKAAEAATKRGDEQAAEKVLQRGAALPEKKQTVKTEKATVSTRTVFDSYEIINFKAVPAAMLMIDERELREHVNRCLKEKTPTGVPGLKIITREQVSVR